jgi:hypothetical protein
MELNPSWEDDRSTLSQEIQRILWNLTVHYRIHKRSQLVPALSHIIFTPPSRFLKILFNVILLSTPRASKYPLSLRLSRQNPVCTLSYPHTFHIPCRSHSSWFDHQGNGLNMLSIQIYQSGLWVIQVRFKQGTFYIWIMIVTVTKMCSVNILSKNGIIKTEVWYCVHLCDTNRYTRTLFPPSAGP